MLWIFSVKLQEFFLQVKIRKKMIYEIIIIIIIMLQSYRQIFNIHIVSDSLRNTKE